RQVADVPQTDVVGKWETSTPATRAGFSAVGYYFGGALRDARKIPIGLIHTSWGGTPAEAWTRRSALEEWGRLPPSAFKSNGADAKAKTDYENLMAAWRAAGSPQGHFDDPGISDAAKSWASPQTDTRDWLPVSLPQNWERIGPEMQIDGGVWFRKEVDIP